MIILFDDTRAVDVALVGGKAASLARLSQAGFRVPPGFTLSTAAQAEFFAAHDLNATIAALLAKLDYDDPVALENVTTQIRALIESHPLPEGIAADVERHYAVLGADSYVAVRSSGTAEDLADASLFLMNQYNENGLINIGTGSDISILDLTKMICTMVGFRGSLKTDTTKPDGTPQKLLDISKISSLGWKARIGLVEGIKKVYEQVKNEI